MGEGCCKQASRITLSDRAAEHVKKVLSAEPEGTMLRIVVSGGGCSGFRYDFKLDSRQASDDFLLECCGARVVVDPRSLDFLEGARIDMTDDLINQSLRVNIPKATSSCGCGTSFSV